VETSEQPTRAVRLFVLGDQSIFRQALLRYFESEAGLAPVGASDYRDDFYPALLAARPDIVLLDPGGQRDRLPCLLAELRRRSAGVGVIVLTLDFDRAWSAVALAAGADAFVDKERTVENLLAAIWREARARARS
jgi:DNA-binding NarL/FixJ family response regulator